MEGPSIRTFPRMELRNSVEVEDGRQTRRIEKAIGNLSAGGLFVLTDPLPVSQRVHVRIRALHPFECDGVVRFYEASLGGVGIEFVELTEPKRRALDALIAELTEKGAPIV